MKLAGVLLAALLAPGRADACTGAAHTPSAKQIAADAPDVFAWFEQAAVVAEVEVIAAPGFTNEGHGLRGDVVFKVAKTLKGKPGATITIVQEMTPCGGESKGNTYLAFFDAKGHRTGVTDLAMSPWLALWQKLFSDGDRAMFLKKLATNTDPLVAGAATKRLAMWSDPPKDWKRPGTAQLAVARVHAQWSALLAVAPRLATFDRCTLEATKQSCASAKQHIADVASPAQLGDVGALATGDCWTVACAVGFYTLNVYVGAADGRVLVVWIPPEG